MVAVVCEYQERGKRRSADDGRDCGCSGKEASGSPRRTWRKTAQQDLDVGELEERWSRAEQNGEKQCEVHLWVKDTGTINEKEEEAVPQAPVIWLWKYFNNYQIKST